MMVGKGNSKTVCVHGHKLSSDNRVGGTGRCIACRDAYSKNYAKTHPEEIRTSRRAWKRKYRRENPQANKQEWLAYKYRMTLEEYSDLIIKQGNCCAICHIVFSTNSRDTTPCVDHDHSCCSGERACGKCNRGILCGRCNKHLGGLRDNVNTLRSAIQYLNSYK